MQMFRDTKGRNFRGCLQNDFQPGLGEDRQRDLRERAKVDPSRRPSEMTRDEAEALHKAIIATKIMAPPTDCIAPIGEDLIEAALRRPRSKPTSTRVVDAQAGGLPRQPVPDRDRPGLRRRSLNGDDSSPCLRFANRVPLQYQQGACAITKAVTGTDWKSYQMQQPRGALPVGPMLLMVHIASVWVPFTSESKEAIAHYPEIIKETAPWPAGVRARVAGHIRKRKREADELKKRAYIEKYIPRSPSACSRSSGSRTRSAPQGRHQPHGRSRTQQEDVGMAARKKRRRRKKASAKKAPGKKAVAKKIRRSAGKTALARNGSEANGAHEPRHRRRHLTRPPTTWTATSAHPEAAEARPGVSDPLAQERHVLPEEGLLRDRQAEEVAHPHREHGQELRPDPPHDGPLQGTRRNQRLRHQARRLLRQSKNWDDAKLRRADPNPTR